MYLNILAFIAIAAASAIEEPAPTYLGCFSSTSKTISAGFVSLGTFEFQSLEYCGNLCYTSGFSAFALTSGNECSCGSALPPSSDLVDASQCSLPCQGYAMETCGGSDALDVYSIYDVSYPTGTASITAGITAVPTTSTGYDYTALFSSSNEWYTSVPDSSSSVIDTTSQTVEATAGSGILTTSTVSPSSSSTTTPAATTTSLHSSTANIVTPSASTVTSSAESPTYVVCSLFNSRIGIMDDFVFLVFKTEIHHVWTQGRIL
ncbi:hypothetical protein UA08_01034 [Talaromyces atroroseus]|uniref:WSC domain-containing protein n=1 Tax=Talaromyces atroroseus TaxID=1441469 RepID=A0A225AZ03_TALAT|nr:hypothetical protein UA08_01034 [Talaromyces atroroseus]OKL63684.1 hypothetical protein UA08_01034 [Talaromyces atroroseus]